MTEENKKRDERQEIRDQRLEEVLKQNTTILCDTGITTVQLILVMNQKTMKSQCFP